MEYCGSKQNNIVGLMSDGVLRRTPAEHCLVLHELEDPDPNRRFKMVYEASPTTVSVAFSADGLQWLPSSNNPVVTSPLEFGGLVNLAGCYYLNGQGRAIPHPIKGANKRTMITFASYDFEHWTQAAVPSFRRDNVPPRPPTDFEVHRGEQVHVGASLWNRGNVLIGIYGQYHNETNHRPHSTVDLGLLVSNDAMHFKEPLPDFKMIPSYEEPDGAAPRLLQGQGFENIGERSIFWYSVWREVGEDSPTGVRVATWLRDRLSSFSPAPKDGPVKMYHDVAGAEPPHFVSCPIELDQGRTRLYVNADVLSEHVALTVEILSQEFQPLPGYSRDECIPLTQSGLRQPVVWRDRQSLEGLDKPIRLKVVWEGPRPQEACLYAVYVG